MTHFGLHLAPPVDRSSHRLHACNNTALFFSFSYFELFSFNFFSFCFLILFLFSFLSFFIDSLIEKLYIFQPLPSQLMQQNNSFLFIFLMFIYFVLFPISFLLFLFPFLFAILDIYLFILRYTIHI